ncbi:MAG: hypothetical protein ABF296_05440 [Oceanococcaceae bacterium]
MAWNRKSAVVAAGIVGMAVVILVWVGLRAGPSSLELAPIPAACALLDESTLAASQRPPPTQADYDHTLAVLERNIAAGGTMFINEAATRRLQRFQALRDVDDLQRAEELTTQQLEANTGDPAARARRAAIRIARHDFTGALDDAQASGAVVLEVDALEELGRFDEARARLAQLPEAGMSALLRHARAADNAGESERAATLLDAAIQEARYTSLPSTALAGLLAQRGTLALHNGDFSGACAAYTEALNLHPGQISTLEWLGRWAWHAGQPMLAWRFVQRAAELDPQNAGLQQLLVEIADDARMRESAPDIAAVVTQARQAVGQLTQRWPDWYRLMQAENLASAGEVARAQALVAEERERRQGREWLAAAVHVHTESGDFAAAEGALQALQNNGVLHPPVLYRAWRYYRARGMSEAAEAAAVALAEGRIELSPDEWRNLASAQSLTVAASE